MSLFSGNDVTALAKVFEESQKKNDERVGLDTDPQPTFSSPLPTTGNPENKELAKPFHKSVVRSHVEDKIKKMDIEKEVKSSIWDSKEIEKSSSSEHDSGENIDNDPREVPDYSFSYRQKVGVEDMYYGMNTHKRNDISTCDELVVTIDIPKVKDISTVDLIVNEMRLDLSCREYVLRTALPKKVFKGHVKCDYVQDKKKLVVSVPIDIYDIPVPNEQKTKK